MNRLQNKVAIVTGGSSGIGNAIAAAFLHEGASVLITDIKDEADLVPVNAAKDRWRYSRGDVSRAENVEATVDEAIATFGRLDIVVNCAGFIHQGEDVTEQGEEIFDRTMAINLKGPWLYHHYALPHMRAQNYGVIINIGSIGGLVGFPCQAAYGISKAGLHQLTRAAASEFVADGIRVNAIAPGGVFTPMARAQRPAMTEAEAKEDMRINTLSKRIGEPQDIANATVFLASDDAIYITGQVIVVDGGSSVLWPRKLANTMGKA